MTFRVFVQIVVSIALLASISAAYADSKSTNFGYDANGQLTTGFYDNAKCILYAYDPNGNRTSQETVTKDASPPIWGQVNWGGVNWTRGAADPIWASGSWGCFLWAPP